MVEFDLSELPTEVIRSALCDTVEKELRSKKYKIHVDSASKAGEHNFMGDVHRVSFSKEDEAEKVHKLILKVAPQNEARRNAFKSRDMFLREIFMYEKVLPYFRQFEQSKGVIMEENGFTEYPKCYRSVDTEPSECVFLEDLSVRDFTIIDRYTEEVSAEHVRLVMKVLGKFHAISFALKDQQPDKFKELTSDLPEAFIGGDDPHGREYFRKTMEDVLDVIPNEEDAVLRSKLKKLFERDVNDIALDCVDARLAEPATVLSHGDVWQNNTMFRYDENQNLIEVCLLDWQVSRHSSPIIDLVYFIFMCTTKELRDIHYDEFLKIYHDSLSTHILKLGSDPEKLFPHKLMLEHFRKFGKFGLFMSIMALPMITSESGKGLDLDELAVQFEDGAKFTENIFFSNSKRDKYSKRMRDVIIDMVRLEYI